MVRPRWHDALMISAIVGLLVVGVWSLWWEDVRSVLHLSPDSASEPAAESAPGSAGMRAPIAHGQT